MKQENILVIGSGGQVGTDLVERLRTIYGENKVIASDIREPKEDKGPFELLDVMDGERLNEVFKKYNPSRVYHLAAFLSASAEQHPKKAWKLNMDGLFNVFDLALEYKTERIFWPSSIAVFGPTTPKVNTPQDCVMDPNTIYGISKQAGERYCEYYHRRYGLDVRSLRYPGLIGWKAEAGGGTTDYAVEIFSKALAENKYTSFLKEDATLPMMYIDDAIRATIEITEAPAEQIGIRSSYNLAAMSFSPEELAEEIKKHLPDFTISYTPDHRQKIAESWPQSIDDSVARDHWNWKEEYNVEQLVKTMLENLRPRVQGA